MEENLTLGSYVPEFRDYVLEKIKVVGGLDRAAGLCVRDVVTQFGDPNSTTSRIFFADLGEERNRKFVQMLIVLQDLPCVKNPGESNIYSSGVTQSLVYLAEAVSGRLGRRLDRGIRFLRTETCSNWDSIRKCYKEHRIAIL